MERRVYHIRGLAYNLTSGGRRWQKRSERAPKNQTCYFELVYHATAKTQAK